MSFNKRSSKQLPLPSCLRSTYHLEGILHRLRYLNCHRPKSYVCMPLRSAKNIQSFIVIRNFTLFTQQQHQPPITACACSAPFAKVSIVVTRSWWWRLQRRQQPKVMRKQRDVHAPPPTNSNQITPNQFNFHFINDLIISPGTVKCTRLPGTPRKLWLFARQNGCVNGKMRMRMGKNENEIDTPKNDIKSLSDNWCVCQNLQSRRMYLEF